GDMYHMMIEASTDISAGPLPASETVSVSGTPNTKDRSEVSAETGTTYHNPMVDHYDYPMVTISKWVPEYTLCMLCI
ncbi:hypothetical protein KIPB_017092, partial [Kipferlia bialata]